MLPHPISNSESKKAPPALVWWIIWVGLMGQITIVQLVVGGGIPSGSNAPAAGIDPFVAVSLGVVAIATVIRWLALPRCARVVQKFVLMIVGLSLSESAAMFGLFLIPHDQPETKLVLFVLSLLGMAQFAPFYAQAKPRAKRVGV